MRLLEAGKHVCVEKPLATITREAQDMVAKAEEKGVKITLNLGNRWNGGFQNIHDSIQAGEVGDPVFGYCRCSDTIWVPTQMLSGPANRVRSGSSSPTRWTSSAGSLARKPSRSTRSARSGY